MSAFLPRREGEKRGEDFEANVVSRLSFLLLTHFLCPLRPIDCGLAVTALHSACYLFSLSGEGLRQIERNIRRLPACFPFLSFFRPFSHSNESSSPFLFLFPIGQTLRLPVLCIEAFCLFLLLVSGYIAHPKVRRCQANHVRALRKQIRLGITRFTFLSFWI